MEHYEYFSHERYTRQCITSIYKIILIIQATFLVDKFCFSHALSFPLTSGGVGTFVSEVMIDFIQIYRF